MQHTVNHNPEEKKFSVEYEGETAYLSYSEQDGALDYSHTYTPDAIRGKGIASQIIKAALDYARESGKKVVPSCPFVATYITRHSEYEAVLAPSQE